MNVIVICSDTFRYDHLGFLGRQPVHTPNIDQLARDSASFSDFRLCSFPTVLNRIEVFSGRYTFPLIDWGPLPFEYPVLSEVFTHHGFGTGFVADNPHLMKEEFGFGRGFNFVKDVPGQADDPFLPESAPMIDLPCAAEQLDPRKKRLDRYRRNAAWYRQQGTNTTETVFREAMQWVGKAQDNFFLWIDAFDPHEPWDAPERFRQLYPWNDRGGWILWPRYGKASRYTAADLDNMRSLYRSEVSQIDHWVGQFINYLRDGHRLADTTVIFCSDHGYYLGEHDLLGKLRLERPTVIYDELGHAPLLLRHPAGLGAGKTFPGLCQPPDLFATAIDLAGIPRVPWAQGHSLVARLNGESPAQKFAVGGCHPRKKNVGCLTVWTDDWCFIYSPQDGLDGSELYQRASDPGQTANVLASHRSVAEDHFRMLCSWLDDLKISPSRRRQLLHAKGFNWLDDIRQRLWLRRNRRSYEKQFRDYGRQRR
jgi:arylsulfatase A-like enzyme